MPTVDADAHVIETERTWEYMVGPDAEHKPVGLIARDEDGSRREFWMIDGRLQPRRDNIGADTTEATREMADIGARLEHMDALDVDVQVLYPTVFLRPITERAEVELALCRAYNRWLADIWAQSPSRLPWAAVLPLLNMDAALEELKWCRNHGACVVFMRSLEAGNRQMWDPYFFPLYDLAQDLDLPIGVHAANANVFMHDFFAQEPGFYKFKLATIGAFHAVLWTKLPERFPRLRIGFIETSSQWVPYALNDLGIRLRRRGEELRQDVLRANRIWVACQTDDDLPYVLGYAGEDHLVIGSDYGHADTSSELEALRHLKLKGEVAPHVIDKILDQNARVFYALD